MAQDLYARRLNAATAFFRQAESMLEPSYKEKLDMDMAKKKELMEADLDFYIEKNKIANQSAIEQLRKQKERFLIGMEVDLRKNYSIWIISGK